MKGLQTNGLARLHILAHKAWQAHAYYQGLQINDSKAEESYRRSVIEKYSGQRSAKGLSKEQYEDVMLDFAMTAQEDKETLYWSTARDRRYRYQVNHFLQLLAVARGEVTSWSYVRSIMDQMSLPEYLDDVPAEKLQNVIAALDTHFRRLCRELDHKPADIKRAIATGDKAQARQTKHVVEHHRKFSHK